MRAVVSAHCEYRLWKYWIQSDGIWYWYIKQASVILVRASQLQYVGISYRKLKIFCQISQH